jgi:hypothetical protein
MRGEIRTGMVVFSIPWLRGARLGFILLPGGFFFLGSFEILSAGMPSPFAIRNVASVLP